MASPFASLPIELVLSVVSIAAVDQPTALALSLVSSWVCKHVEPALYHTVCLRSARSLVAFIATLDGKPLGFGHKTVKRLCITALGPISSIQTILSQCTGIVSLAAGFSVPSYVHRVCGRLSALGDHVSTAPAFGRLSSAPSEQHLLSLACRDGLDMAILSPSVVRLRVQLTRSVTAENVARLAELHHLTHLAVAYGHGVFGGVEDVGAMLWPVMRRGRLRVLVLQVAGGAADAHLEDVRRWCRMREASGVSKEVGTGGRARVIVSACKVPLSFLSEWEQSDAFWQWAEDSGVSIVI